MACLIRDPFKITELYTAVTTILLLFNLIIVQLYINRNPRVHIESGAAHDEFELSVSLEPIYACTLLEKTRIKGLLFSVQANDWIGQL